MQWIVPYWDSLPPPPRSVFHVSFICGPASSASEFPARPPTPLVPLLNGRCHDSTLKRRERCGGPASRNALRTRCRRPKKRAPSRPPRPVPPLGKRLVWFSAAAVPFSFFNKDPTFKQAQSSGRAPGRGGVEPWGANRRAALGGGGVADSAPTPRLRRLSRGGGATPRRGRLPESPPGSRDS